MNAEQNNQELAAILSNINPAMRLPLDATSLKTEPDFDMAIALLVHCAGGEVPDGVKVKATEIAHSVAKTKIHVRLLDLVEAFEQAPELEVFAAQLRKVILPGAYSKYFA